MQRRARLSLFAALTLSALLPGCSSSPQSGGEWTEKTNSDLACESLGPGVHLASCGDTAPIAIHLPPHLPPFPAIGPVTLVSGLNNSFALAVDAVNVYYGDLVGNVSGIPIGGGTPFTVATGQGPIEGLAAFYQSYSPTIARPNFNLTESSALYWAAVENVGGIDIRGATGAPVGSPRVLGSGKYPFGVALDFGHLYWTDSDIGSDGPVGNGTVNMVSIQEWGGPPETLYTGGAPSGVAVDGTNVYWADLNCCVMKKPLAGGPAVALATGLQQTAYMAIDSTPTAGSNASNVYWAEAYTNDNGTIGYGNVSTVPVSGGTPRLLATGCPGSIAADSSGVYWTDWCSETINALYTGQSSPVVLASNQNFDGQWPQLALDATSVYWLANQMNVTGNPLALMKVAK